jgi:non-specific serine/threonine protein kinase
MVGGVHFNLAENWKDEAAPFAFMATYTTGLSVEGKAQHLPLGKAAAEACAWLKGMVDVGQIYHPLRWSPSQTVQLLKDVPARESAGVVVRLPASWRMNRPARPQVKATVRGKAPSELGLDALLDFQMEVTLDGDLGGPACGDGP